MLDALEIDDDDDVSIVEAVEEAFGITISDAEAGACFTVSDLFALVCAKVPTVDASDQLPCLTATAFRAIRRAIRARHPGLGIRPNTRLDRMIDGPDHRAWRDYLASETGLHLPNPSLPNMAPLVAVFAIAAGSAVSVMGLSGGSLFAAGLIGLLSAIGVGYAYGRWAWSEFTTIGDLARQASALSIAQAVKANGAVRRGEAWTALVTVVSGFSLRTGDVGPATRFFTERR
ncbi:acyl carrier protein [Bosea sp. BK604]|uniref:acyl carrier protein n=1 Tax=Bosea sp. BK604 TaxID=2512180 RepID=UPI00104ADAF6|nr:acyl carrier protein [Bosea sp. BK604]